MTQEASVRTQAGGRCASPEEEVAAPTLAIPSPSPPAHRSNRLLIKLNPQWRVVDDDLQYILQCRKGQFRSKATGWCCRSFCRTRKALLRCIREHCGLVDETALEQVHAVHEWHIKS